MFIKGCYNRDVTDQGCDLSNKFAVRMTRIDSFHKVVNVSGWYTPQDGVKVNDRSN